MRTSPLQRAVLQQLGGEWTGGLMRHDPVVLAMHDQNRHRNPRIMFLQRVYRKLGVENRMATANCLRE